MFKTNTWEKAIEFASSYRKNEDRLIVIIGVHQREAVVQVWNLSNIVCSRPCPVLKHNTSEFVTARTTIRAIGAKDDCLRGLEPTLIVFELNEELPGFFDILKTSTKYDFVMVAPRERDEYVKSLLPNLVAL